MQVPGNFAVNHTLSIAAVPGSGIWKSMDGGKNWRRIQSGFPQGLMGRAALALGSFFA
jgi:hypothetical protein